jgi:hypothetical protein
MRRQGGPPLRPGFGVAQQKTHASRVAFQQRHALVSRRYQHLLANTPTLIAPSCQPNSGRREQIRRTKRKLAMRRVVFLPVEWTLGGCILFFFKIESWPIGHSITYHPRACENSNCTSHAQETCMNRAQGLFVLFSR